MLFEYIAIAAGVAIPVVILLAVARFLLGGTPRESLAIDEKELQEAEQALREEGELDWVILKRCHGPAFNHAVMTEIISSLNAEGVTATYDVVASSSVDGGVTNYMLKVLRGEEEKSFAILKNRDS